MLALPSGLAGEARDRWIGTWRLDAPRSNYSPGAAPDSSIYTIDVLPDGTQKHTIETVVQGRRTRSERIARFDGSDVPVVLSGAGEAESARLVTNAYRRINDRTFEVDVKYDHGPVAVTQRVVADGNTMTMTTTGKNAEGEPVNDMSTWLKQ
jgi:hypothetical protein